MKVDALIQQARAARVQSDIELWSYVHGHCPWPPRLRDIAPPPPPPPSPPGPPPQVRHDGWLVCPLGLGDGDTFAGAIARITVGVVVEFVVWCWLSAAGLV